MSIDRVGIVGGGQMGGGIAEVCAKAGVGVIVVEMTDELAAKSKAGIEKSLAKALERGKIDDAGRDAAMAHLTFTTDLGSFSDRALVIEAVVEDLEVKRDLFGRIDDIVDSPDAILASNTSSIPITQIATATGRPESVIGMHFFNPATVMPLVEVISTVVTDETVATRAADFATDRLGKTVVHAKDRAGFIVNKLLCPYIFGRVSNGTSHLVGSHRQRHDARCRRCLHGGVPGPPLRSTPTPAPHGRGRPPRPKVRQRLLRLHLIVLAWPTGTCSRRPRQKRWKVRR